jgi:uncharacterized membrane protein YqiK
VLLLLLVVVVVVVVVLLLLLLLLLLLSLTIARAAQTCLMSRPRRLASRRPQQPASGGSRCAE